MRRNLAAATDQRFTRLGELPAKQGIAGTQQRSARRRQTTAIAGIHLQNKILVEQDVTIMGAIGKVIDGENAPYLSALHLFPRASQRIVVDDQPVDLSDALDGFERLLSVVLPTRRKPGCMSSAHLGIVAAVLRIGQQAHRVALASDQRG